MNKVKCTGILTGTEKDKNGHTVITVLVKRPKVDDANIHFLLEKPLSPDIQLRETVNIEGYVRGFHLKDADGKIKVTQILVAEKVTHAVGEMEEIFNIKGHFYKRHNIRIYVDGKINSVLESSKGWKSIMLAFDGDKNIPDVALLGFRENERIPDYYYISKNDRVVACLSVRTSDKTINGEDKHFVNIVVDDLVITNREIPKKKTETVEKTENNDLSVVPTGFAEEDKTAANKDITEKRPETEENVSEDNSGQSEKIDFSELMKMMW